MPKQHLAFIDSLRGIAILLVIMLHCNSYGLLRLMEVDGMIFKAIGHGGKGVQLFFILSSLTLFISIKSKSDFSGIYDLGKFFIRRFFRIGPMWLFGIVLYFLIFGFGSRSENDLTQQLGYFEIFINAIFLNGFFPNYLNSVVPGGWSIGDEMIFYFIFPLLFIKITNINKALLFSLLSILGIAILSFFTRSIGSGYENGIWSSFLYYYFPNQLQVFSLGFILYFLLFENGSVQTHGIRPSTYFLLLFMIFFELFFNIKIFRTHLLFSVGFALLIYVLAKWPNKLFINRILGFIGKISFSIYIIHFAILHYFSKLGFLDLLFNPIQNYLLKYALVAIFSIGLSTITYYLIEKPGQKIGMVLISKIKYYESIGCYPGQRRE
jgi:peptidoglycan/LPS O-acetylase OafA/YrhL